MAKGSSDTVAWSTMAESSAGAVWGRTLRWPGQLVLFPSFFPLDVGMASFAGVTVACDMTSAPTSECSSSNTTALHEAGRRCHFARPDGLDNLPWPHRVLVWLTWSPWAQILTHLPWPHLRADLHATPVEAIEANHICPLAFLPTGSSGRGTPTSLSLELGRPSHMKHARYPFWRYPFWA